MQIINKKINNKEQQSHDYFKLIMIEIKINYLIKILN